MSTVFGVFSLTVAALMFAVALRASRNPNAPTWLTTPPIADVIVISIMCPGVFGVGFALQSIAHFSTQPPTLLQGILIVANLLVFVFIWKRLKLKATLEKYALQMADTKIPAATTAPPNPASGAAHEMKAVGIGTVTTVPENPNSPCTPRTPGRPKKAA